MNSVATSRIIEPLCAATQTTIEPINFGSHEYVLVDVDDDVERFIIKPVRSFPQSEYQNKESTFTDPLTNQPMVEMGSANMYLMNALIRRIPEKMELGFGKWKVAGTDFSAIVLCHCVPEGRLVFMKREAKMLYDFLLLRFASQNKSAYEVANFKSLGELPALPSDYIPHPELPLVPFQLSALLASLGKESYALFLEQGTGKTPITVSRINLEGARKRSSGKGMYKTLVICPGQVKKNWESEFERFSTYPGKVSILDGGILRRIKNILDSIRDEADCAWSACIISIDSVDSSWDALRRVSWDLVVVDESHYMKNHNSQRFRVLKLFRELGTNTSRMILTGTPIANVLFDLWSQLEFLAKGLSGFMSFENFKRFHGVFEKRNGTPIEKLTALKGIPLIQERLARVSYILKRADANMSLPDKLYDIYEVEMTAKQTKIYGDLASQLAVEIEEMLESTGENKSLVIEHVLTKLLRLAQITSGHIKWDETLFPEQIDSVNPKAKAVVDILSEEGRDPNGKMIVWCCFDEDIRIVSEYLHKAGINHVGYKPQVAPEYRVSDAGAAERRYNTDQSCKVFLGNPASGGSGLNLLGYDRENPDDSPCYTNREIYFSCNWSAIQRSQSEDRAVRKGMRQSVMITDLIVSGTIDDEIRSRVKNKIDAANSIQNITQILESLRGFYSGKQ